LNIAPPSRRSRGGVFQGTGASRQENCAMVRHGKTDSGQFCWLDLAATDAGSAKAFYRKMFGWTSHEQAVNGGSFIRLRLSNQDVGSIYQLRETLLERGVSSHWTPYVRVIDVDDSIRRTVLFGGTVVVHPFLVSGVARIALILDSVGALVGLWEPVELNMKVNGHG